MRPGVETAPERQADEQEKQRGQPDTEKHQDDGTERRRANPHEQERGAPDGGQENQTQET